MAHHFKSFTHSIDGATVTIKGQTAGSGENASFRDNKITISEDSNDPNQEAYTHSPSSGDPITGNLHFCADTSGETPKLMVSSSRNGSCTSKADLTSGEIIADLNFKPVVAGWLSSAQPIPLEAAATAATEPKWFIFRRFKSPHLWGPEPLCPFLTLKIQACAQEKHSPHLPRTQSGHGWLRPAHSQQS